MPFTNRREAERKLAAALARYKNERPLVLALPRGGVLVAAEVATALKAPLGLILVHKIGLPAQPGWSTARPGSWCATRKSFASRE